MPARLDEPACVPVEIVAYHGGADMLEELRARSLPFVRTQTARDVSANKFMCRFLQHAPPDDRTIVHDGDVARPSEEFAAREITHVIPTDEAGVELTDLLCHESGLSFNGMEKSAARRDKRLMHAAVAERGLRVPLQSL